MTPTFHKFRSANAMSQVVARTLNFILVKSLIQHDHASLMLSGGSTPKEAYNLLSQMPVAWKDVDIGLVDERWVDETDLGSNAAMVRQTLIKNRAQDARFHPLKSTVRDLDMGCVESNTRYGAIPHPYSAIVLGMGADGHTASWFPDAQGLDEALDIHSEKIVVPVRPIRSGITGDYLERATLTLSSFKRSGPIILLITGRNKRSTYNEALSDPSCEYPIRKLIDAFGDRLTVYWAP